MVGPGAPGLGRSLISQGQHLPHRGPRAKAPHPRGPGKLLAPPPPAASPQPRRAVVPPQAARLPLLPGAAGEAALPEGGGWRWASQEAPHCTVSVLGASPGRASERQGLGEWTPVPRACPYQCRLAPGSAFLLCAPQPSWTPPALPPSHPPSPARPVAPPTHAAPLLGPCPSLPWASCSGEPPPSTGHVAWALGLACGLLRSCSR